MKKKNMIDEIFKIGFPTEIVQEGEVKVLVPKLEEFVKLPSEYAPSKAPVFYNPVMELNRDFAVLVLQAYQRMVNREISVCEPLAGCGIRGIRFVAEVEGVKKAVDGLMIKVTGMKGPCEEAHQDQLKAFAKEVMGTKK